MGEVADDMIDGTCCQFCGVWHPDILATKEGEVFTPQGYPWTCDGCKDDDDGS